MARAFSGSSTNLSYFRASGFQPGALATDVTIGWRCRLNSDVQGAIVGHRSGTGGFGVRRTSGGVIVLSSWINSDVQSSAGSWPFVSGQIDNFLIVKTGTSIAFFRNNVAVGTATVASWGPAAHDLMIGTWNDFGIPRSDFMWNGLIQDVFMVNRALTTTERAQWAAAQAVNYFGANSSSGEFYYTLDSQDSSPPITEPNSASGGLNPMTGADFGFQPTDTAGEAMTYIAGALSLAPYNQHARLLNQLMAR